MGTVSLVWQCVGDGVCGEVSEWVV